MLFLNVLWVFFLIFVVSCGCIMLLVCFVIRDLRLILLIILIGLSMLFFDFDILLLFLLWIRFVMYMVLNGICVLLFLFL